MSAELICHNCNNAYKRKPSEVKGSKFCSNNCKWIFNNWSGEDNTECTECGKSFHMKESDKIRYSRKHGYFCSVACSGKYKSKGVYSGVKNPNYKTGRDNRGIIRLSVETCAFMGLKKGMRIHRAICCEHFGISNIPKGFHVHHRDCDVRNNSPENLVVLTVSDHKWLHKQFGNATLWAHFHGRVSTDDLASWSDDSERANRLLGLNVIMQDAGIFGNTGGLSSTGVN